MSIFHKTFKGCLVAWLLNKSDLAKCS